MTWILSWLMGSKIGRMLGLGLVGAVMLLTVTAVIFRKGEASERAKQRLRQLERVRIKMKVTDEIRNMSPSERRDELARWVVPNGE